eukprot:622826-Prymnesium_polylepis.1
MKSAKSPAGTFCEASRCKPPGEVRSDRSCHKVGLQIPMDFIVPHSTSREGSAHPLTPAMERDT